MFYLNMEGLMALKLILGRYLNRPAPKDPIKRAQLLVANNIEWNKIKGVYHG